MMKLMSKASALVLVLALANSSIPSTDARRLFRVATEDEKVSVSTKQDTAESLEQEAEFWDRILQADFSHTEVPETSAPTSGEATTPSPTTTNSNTAAPSPNLRTPAPSSPDIRTPVPTGSSSTLSPAPTSSPAPTDECDRCSEHIPCGDDGDRIYVCLFLEDGSSLTTCPPLFLIELLLNANPLTRCGECENISTLRPAEQVTFPPALRPTIAPSMAPSQIGTSQSPSQSLVSAEPTLDDGELPETPSPTSGDVDTNVPTESDATSNSPTQGDLTSVPTSAEETNVPTASDETNTPTASEVTNIPTLSGTFSPTTSAVPTSAPSSKPSVSMMPSDSSMAPTVEPFCDPLEVCNDGAGFLVCADVMGRLIEICVPNEFADLVEGRAECGSCPTLAPTTSPAPTITASPTITFPSPTPSSAPTSVFDGCDPVEFCGDDNTSVLFCLQVGDDETTICVPPEFLQRLLPFGECGECQTDPPTEEIASLEPTMSPTGLLDGCDVVDVCNFFTVLPIPPPDVPEFGVTFCLQIGGVEREICADPLDIQDLLTFGECGPCASEAPSSVPSSVPSISSSPTKAITDVPSSSPSRMPTGTPSNTPSSTPSTSVPSTSPSQSPSTSATITPTTATPTTTPSSLPTGSPSALPTVSVMPTSSPTDINCGNETIACGPNDENVFFCLPKSRDFPASQFATVCIPEDLIGPALEVGGFCGICPQDESMEPSLSLAPSVSVEPSDVPSISMVPSNAPSPSPTSSCIIEEPCDDQGRIVFCFNGAEVCVLYQDWMSKVGVCGPCPSDAPSLEPSSSPTATPSSAPTNTPSALPTVGPSFSPSRSPTITPTPGPSSSPTLATEAPTVSESRQPSAAASNTPTMNPTETTRSPTHLPSSTPTAVPSEAPTTSVPSADPSAAPSAAPTPRPTNRPTLPEATPFPTATPTTATPTGTPSSTPTSSPSQTPSATPSTQQPSEVPTSSPTILCDPMIPCDDNGSVYMCLFVVEANRGKPELDVPVPVVEECLPPEFTFEAVDFNLESSILGSGSRRRRSLQESGPQEFYTECVPVEFIQPVLESGLGECGPCDTQAPSSAPTEGPSDTPSAVPTGSPSSQPTLSPSTAPSSSPTDTPSAIPTYSFQCPGEICYDAPDLVEDDYVFVCIGGVSTVCVSQEDAILLLLDPANFCGQCEVFDCDTDLFRCQGNKVQICHYEGGGQNSEICIPYSSLETHREGHCDYCGECLPEPPPDKCEGSGNGNPGNGKP